MNKRWLRQILAFFSLTAAALAQREPLLIASSPSEGAVNVYQLDDAKLKLKKSIAVSKAPGQLCLDPGGAKLYVVDAPGKLVTGVDLEQQAVIGTFTAPELKGPDGCTVSPDGKKLYLADREGNQLFIFATDIRHVSKRFAVPNEPRRVVFTPDNSKVLVSSGDGNAITIIDPANDAIVRSVKTGTDPRAMAFSPDSKLLAVSMVTSDNMEWFDANTLEYIEDWGMCTSPQVIAFAPNGRYLYALCVPAQAIAVVNLHGEGARPERRLQSTIPIGAVTSAMALSPAGDFLYIGRPDGTIGVVDLLGWKIYSNKGKGGGPMIVRK
jgi:YVTN family beta-propeller protein